MSTMQIIDEMGCFSNDEKRCSFCGERQGDGMWYGLTNYRPLSICVDCAVVILPSLLADALCNAYRDNEKRVFDRFRESRVQFQYARMCNKWKDAKREKDCE